LAYAENLHEVSIVNFHRTESAYLTDPSFLGLLNKHNSVKAVFNGHIHEYSGVIDSTLTTHPIPRYIAGTPMEGQFMLVELADQSLYIWKMFVDVYAIDASTGKPKLYVSKPDGTNQLVSYDDQSLHGLFAGPKDTPLNLHKNYSYVVPLY
jgi:hypothetical protein